MGKDESCKRLCITEAIPKPDADFINQCIADDYALNFVVDGLPAAHITTDEHTNEEYYSIGFRLGDPTTGLTAPSLNNHYEINIDYHERPDNKKRVVGVVVRPYSRNTEVDDEGKPICEADDTPFRLDADKKNVVYTYSVHWRVSVAAKLSILQDSSSEC